MFTARLLAFISSVNLYRVGYPMAREYVLCEVRTYILYILKISISIQKVQLATLLLLSSCTHTHTHTQLLEQKCLYQLKTYKCLSRM